MGAASVKILLLHFKQNVSHFTLEQIFAGGNVRVSRLMNLPP